MAYSPHCGAMGCALTLLAITRTGQGQDITFTDFDTEGATATANQIFGAIDLNGMPQLVFAGGNLDGVFKHRLFLYDPKIGRYRFQKDVSGYGAGKTLVRIAAAPTRTFPQSNLRMSEDELSIALGPKAPFAQVLIESKGVDYCGRLGCAVVFMGVTRTGQRKDITFNDFMTNGMLAEKDEMFGAIDENGMPEIVYETGLINGGSVTNRFRYDPKLGRYRVAKQVSDNQSGKAAARPGTAPLRAPSIPPVRLAADRQLPANYRDGTFRFGQSSKALCKPLYDGAQGNAALAARSNRQWVEMAQHVIAANCGADVAYYLLGESAEQIGYRDAALSYYREASRIASTPSLRLSEHCVMNKGASGFQKAGPGCFGIPIEAASNDAVVRMQAITAGNQQMAAASAPGLGTIEYEGAIPNMRTTIQQQLQLQIGSSRIVGRLKSQTGVLEGNVPVTGTYANGTCVVQLRGDTDMVGPCDDKTFSGYFVQRTTGRQREKFWFATAARWAEGRPTEVFGSPGLEVAASTVWALGRVRITTTRGQRCSADDQLGKPFCFSEAIRWLQRRPNKNEIDVVAMDDRYYPGSLVPHNNGQGWDIYRVSRRGDGFAADKQRHYGTKVPIPQGCQYDGTRAEGWYITIAGGRYAAVEAQEYICASWGGPNIYTQSVNYSLYDDAQSLDWTGTASEYQRTHGGGQPAYAPSEQRSGYNSFGVPPMRNIVTNAPSTYFYGAPSVPATPPAAASKRRKRR